MTKETPPAAEEVDEFAAIPDAPRRRSPVVAGVVIALGVLVLWHLRADLRYFFQSRTPEDLGDARSVTARQVPLTDNSFVILQGQPDRRNALFIEPRGEKVRQTFYRLYGSGTRLLVRAADTAKQEKIQDRWAGRLRRFDTLPYAQSLRDYFAHEVKASRYLSPETLKAAAQKGGDQQVKDRGGESLSLRRSSEVAIDTANPDYVEVLLSKEKFASEADARHEVERLGLTVRAGYGNNDSFGVVIEAPPAQRNAALAKLDEKGLPFQASQVRFVTHFDQLSAATDALLLTTAEVERADGVRVPVVAAPINVPWAQVKSASVVEPIDVAADAYVLVEDEAPQNFWWAPAIAALLLAFLAFNVWYLLRHRDSRPRHPAPQEG
jgi:hypothetical protein